MAPTPAPALAIASDVGVCTTAPAGVTDVATLTEFEAMFSRAVGDNSCAKEIMLDAAAEYASTHAQLRAVPAMADSKW